MALAAPMLCVTAAWGQTTDTQVDVGGYSLHFHIVKGTGTPILFESGGGDDATVWRDVLPPLTDITHATLITYDRSGFGNSGLDANRHGIENGVSDLEKGLKSLGYDGDFVLVGHSFGGFYSTLYASRHPGKVKAAVLIDANNICFYTPERQASTQKSIDASMAKFKGVHSGSYYQSIDFSHTVDVMRKAPFPASVPVIDIVSDKTPFSDAAEIQGWKRCHQQFAAAAPNRQGIVAYGSGHYVFKDKPILVVNAIVKAYADALGGAQRKAVLERSLSYNIDAANENKQP
jgi:pimeloyl-ACP methyl ester carboxylesterase